MHSPITNTRQNIAPKPRFQSLLLLACFLVWSLASPIQAQQGRVDAGGKRDLTVYTQNLYVGTEFDAVLGLDPSDPNYFPNLIQAVTQTYYSILYSRPDLRVAAVASAIAQEKPEIVMIQEVTLLRIQSPSDLITGGTIPATEVDLDFLELLLASLQVQGASYEVAAITPEFDLELPMLNLQTGTLDDIRLTDHDVILVRSDLPPGYLRTSNPQGGNFQTQLTIPGVGLSITRGWCSIDVFSRGRNVRLINTHLELETSPEIQAAQALELMAGPANVPSPVILAGDFNSDANRIYGTPTYDILLNNGFMDTWNAVHPDTTTYTWGHDPFLANPSLPLIMRLDYVLCRGETFTPVATSILDINLPQDTPPFWASDHAGVVARLMLQ